MAEYGELLSIPIDTPSTKNSTEATEPLSEALAVIGIIDPVIKPAPLEGDVMLTIGSGLLETLMVIAEEIVNAPLLSVAFAVKVCDPAILV